LIRCYYPRRLKGNLVVFQAAPVTQGRHRMNFARFTQTFPREGETAAERYDQLWRELELADQVDF